MTDEKIWTIENKKEEKFLRTKTREFDFEKYSLKDVRELIQKMKSTMRAAHGIWLSANQIGHDYKIFVAEVQDAQGGNKFYAVFNPKVEKAGEEEIVFEEGCLSIPLTYGEVTRPKQITISGQGKDGKPLRIKAWGLLARVFQHEIDHLNGKLFIDRTKNIHKVGRAIAE